MNDGRKTWQHLNRLCYNRDSTPNDYCSKLFINGTVSTNSAEIADSFNSHFVTVAEKIRSKIPTQVSRNPSIPPLISRPFEDFPVTPSEIGDIISGLNNSNAFDVYGMSNNIIKIHRDALTEPMSRLITTSIANGEFPLELKTAIVKPLHKSGDKTNVNNYRPIAIAPILSKVFEAVFLSRWQKHLTKNNILNESQFGFVEKSNTEIALVHLMSDIYSNIESGKFTAALFIDISKAFDCVDHKIFVDKLKSLDLPRNYLNLLSSYCLDRFQLVDINGQRSRKLRVTAGVFQGSVFGPKAFSFYINEVFKLNLRGKLYLYANDTTIVYGEMSLQELRDAMNFDINFIRNFFYSLSLEMNASKTKYILFFGRKRFENFTETSLNLILDNQPVQRVESYKVLGLYIDELLSFETHIDHIYNNCISMVFAIKRIRYNITEKLAYQLYYAHIYSHSIFVNPLWSAGSTTNLNPLFVLQKRFFVLSKTSRHCRHQFRSSLKVFYLYQSSTSTIYCS